MTDPKFRPGTVWNCDNLPILRKMSNECVDLIYLDPPFHFNTNKLVKEHSADSQYLEWSNQIIAICPMLSNFINAFPDQNIKFYLTFMSVRLFEMKRILNQTGSIYLHCDPTMSYLLRSVMNFIFGVESFRNEIIWQYRTGGISKKHYARKHDIILFYGNPNCYFKLPKEESKDPNRYNQTDADGRKYYIKNNSRPYYLDEGVAVTDVWDIPPVRNSSNLEYTGYPNHQKPLTLLDLIIKGSSKENDLIFDPFCGSGTTLISAESLGRNWVGIDIDPKAIEFINYRFGRNVNMRKRL